MKTVKEIAVVCARAFDVTPSALRSPSRQRATVGARHSAALIAHVMGFDNQTIGTALGRDPSTTHTMRRAARDRLMADRGFQSRLAEAAREIGAEEIFGGTA